jgi:hypothetical protein
MENQARFDLNSALESWRTELAAQPNFSADDRRELETHLRDTFGELKSRGLNEEEFFWLARRRVGQPQKLAEEFVKADSTQIWRDRVFWMAVALLTYSLWSYLTSFVTSVAINMITNWRLSLFHNGSYYWFGLNPVVSQLFTATFRLLPFCCLAFLLLKGRLNKDSRVVSFFRSRRNFAIVFVSVISFNSWWPINAWYESQMNIPNLPISTVVHSNLIWIKLIFLVIWPLILTALALWLLPVEKSPAKKRPANNYSEDDADNISLF